MDITKTRYSEANSTAVSLYYSFNSSSVSSPAFKTFETTANDLSMTSYVDPDEDTVENSADFHNNTTLEASYSHENYLKAKEEMEKRPLAGIELKRVLQESNVVSSTPSKEQLPRNAQSVCVIHGETRTADARVMDIKMKRNDMENHDKENTGLHIAEDMNVDEEIDIAPISIVTFVDIATSYMEKDERNVNNNMESMNAEKTPKADVENTEDIKTNKASSVNAQRTTSNRKVPSCEPDLQKNRPSRIVANAKSLVTAVSKPTEEEISETLPKILKKVLKFAEHTNEVKTYTDCKTTFPTDKQRAIMKTDKGRSSMMPGLAQAEKRPYASSNRASVFVKRTLSSPAQKISRRSVAPLGQLTGKYSAPVMQTKNNRKSLLPIAKANSVLAAHATESTTKSNELKTVPSNRKSIFPKVITAVTQEHVKDDRSSRKSVYLGNKQTFDSKMRKSIMPPMEKKSTQPVVATEKAESSYNCNVCGNKFRIKSLLDAHKRSHEDDLSVFVKKPTVNKSSTASTANSDNKCKYCDKKFALLRALHIHLLQNCPKIPPKEKRNLNFTEMNHVEKAQLPSVFHTNNSSITSNGAAKWAPPRLNSDISSASISSIESGKTEVTILANQAIAAVDGLAPPASNTIMKTAHSGVPRTPKSIICHQCKISFKCIMDHVQHNMTVHRTKPNNQNHNDGNAARNAE